MDEAKTEFRKLCKKLHPDTSGYNSGSDFAQMYKQFKAFRPTKQTQQDEHFNADKFYDLVKKFEHLNNIQIDFVGSFIWLTDLEYGAMYKQKESIKKIVIDGYNSARFAGKKKSWYFSPQNYRQKSRSDKTLSELKSKYGCESYKVSKHQLTA